MYIDTHCHLNDQKFDNVDQVVLDYLNQNVSYVINMGCELNSSIMGLEFSKKYPSVYFGCGFHPSDVDKFDKNSLTALEKLTYDSKCVAIGEIGLDYYWVKDNAEKQKKVFLSQLELAKAVKLPVSIHSRDATGDMLKILKENKNLLEYGAVMHCFSGSLETAKELIDLGVYISFGGTLTFKNATNLKEVAKSIPLEYILTETDSPYLSPEPFRGTINQPKNVKLVTEYLAFLRQMPIEEVAVKVLSNAKKVFKKII